MLVEIVVLVITVICTLFLYFQYVFTHWKRLGVPYLEPRFPYGNTQGPKKKIHASKLFNGFYNSFKQSPLGFGGVYVFTQPVVIPTSLKLLKSILVKDFQHFHDRLIYHNEKDDPLSSSLSTIEGSKWKILREKISPTFTSGKMKKMLPLMLEIGERLKTVMNDTAADGNKVDMKNILSRYTADLIGTNAFGINCNCLNDPNAEFLQMGLNFLHNCKVPIQKLLIMISWPKLAKKLGFRLFPKYLSSFFVNVVEDVIKHREESGEQRDDFMNSLIQLKNTGTLTNDKGIAEKVGKVTINEIVSQTFIFFIGGFETSSTTSLFCLHELSLQQDLQDKARESVLKAFREHDNEITYQALSEMSYLDQCVNETLRMYPPVPNVRRGVTKNYKVPNTEIELKKGTMVIIPVYGFHRDPEYFPDPDKFDPERFSPKQVEKRNRELPFVPFLPFGEGPRACIGTRYGLLQIKVALSILLMNYRFRPAKDTKIPPDYNKNCTVLIPSETIYFHVERI